MWERPFRVIQEKRLNKEEIKTSIKKIPAVLLLAILCLTAFHVSVFAAETAEVRIPVRVELAGGKPSPEETYTVVLQAMGEAPMPSESTMEITGDGRASFPAIRYSEPGVYCYTVMQQPGVNKKGHYDNEVYYVKVTVTNGESGGLEAVIAAHTDAEMVSEKQDIAFTNTYDIEKVPTVTPTASPTGRDASKKADSAPKTGDSMNTLMWVCLLGFSGCILSVLLAERMRRWE